jgi:crotonobetainyl-CoA:carnitine CoA-transferase CaiB-like acyl-CoA transferase
MVEGILSGLRVLDFTWILAGPYATRIFADFGAEVIKVQSKKTARGAESNLTGYFNTWNRNKRSITLDMTYPEAREIVLKLTAKSDAVIENFSPRVMSNWGLGYDTLKEANPDLVMISMSSFGQDGPWKDNVGFAPTFHALSGLTYLTSYTQDTPVGPGYAYADAVSGLYAAFAVLSALEYRDRTGQGQYIDLSEYEAICSMIGPSLMEASTQKNEICPHGNHPEDIPAAPFGSYQCSGEDRWCVMAVFGEEEWQNLCRLLGHPDWTNEVRFATVAGRKENTKELDELLTQWTIQRKAEEVVTLLQAAGIPSGVVQNAEDLSRDPQLIARNFFIPLEHPTLGKTISSRSPIRFEEDFTVGWKAAPLLGEDNRYVFLELLGFTEEELSHYMERGAIAF